MFNSINIKLSTDMLKTQLMKYINLTAAFM